MEHYYIALLVFLGLLAVFDLFVGVSNDAVNFLNSALGCRIASFKTTMFVASIGVMLGATFSSGMMEIARSGVFNPQMFTFNEIMVIFFAVMVTDIILLDTFNSLGLPTSTTVSIVFELLGSALAAAAFTLLADGKSLADVAEYINSSRSLTIISGILISVAVAFVAGTVVQYIARLIFTFNFEKMYRRIGGVYAGLAITAIFYFLVMKGAKGASFMRPEWIDFMSNNTLPIVATLFVVLSIVLQLLILVANVNVFKIIILAGTFALAFAFAGNDLVNFVGPVQYAKRVVGRKMYGGQSTFLPVKVNMSGVLPIIFAQSIATLPATIIAFTGTGSSSFWNWMNTYIFDTKSAFYIVCYFLLIIAFSYFYATIQFNPIEIANNLKKNGGFIPGFRPGKPTSDFILKVINKITLFGALYLAIVAILPIIAGIIIKNTSLAVGGTSVIIVVGVALETVKSLEAQMLMRHYKGFLE